MGSAVTGLVGAQYAFTENELHDRLRGRAQHAVERIVAVSRGALTIDAELSPLKPNTGVGSHGLRFRTLQSLQSDGTLVYDADRVFILGPDPGAHPTTGLVIVRGADIDAAFAQSSGPDGTLGTTDDVVDPGTSTTAPKLELLVPDRYAPSAGNMLTLDVAPGGRLLTFNLRLNVRTRNGAFLLPNDLSITQTVALRQ